MTGTDSNMSEIDLTLALQLQAQFEEEARVHLLQQEVERRKAEEISVIASWQGNQNNGSTSSNRFGKQRGGLKGQFEEPDQEKLSVSLIDPSWELIDPNPEIHSLFIAFNQQFFWGRLTGVEVKWSPRMTLCAGVCSYEGRGGLCSVRLSVPLLKLRPRKDLIETLLHEMIHAYLFVTANNRDRDGHGPEFHKHMYRINRVAGTNISVYHSFHDEVDIYRQHVWRCSGPCRTRRPYFGLVKRAMNRAPGPRDPWWQQHQNTCGGSYTKIQEPEGYGNKKKEGKGKVVKKNTDSYGDIRKYVEFKGKGNSLNGHSSIPTKNHSKENIPAFSNASGSDKNLDVIHSREDKAILINSVKRKTGSDHGAHNLFGNSTKTNEKKGNIHGFSSTGTGTVRNIDLSNASKSDVHGFGCSGSPAKKKPNRGSGIGGVGRGRGHGFGGSRKGSVAGTSGGFSAGTGTTKQGRGGGGSLSMRGRGGSTTMTVKGKGTTKTEVKPDHETEKRKESSTVFRGTGFTIGGSGAGVSRLLSLSVSAGPHSVQTPSLSSAQTELRNKASEDNQQHRPQILQNHQCSSPELGEHLSSKCPLCDRDIPLTELNQHLDDCMGLFEDSMGICERNEDELIASMDSRMQDLRNNDGCIDLSTSYEASGAESENFKSRMSGKGRDNDRLGDEEEREVYPCPVCGEKYSQSAMNPHLDSHF